MSVNGLRAFAPNVPSKPTNTLTNNQSGTPTLKVAVLHAVSPNNSNPSMASVLIENRFPPVPGFSLPSGFGPVYPAGTTGVTGPFFNNQSTMEGGSLVTVDTVTNTVIGLRQGVSAQFPSSATIQVQNHVHTGAIDPATGFPMPEEIDLVSHVTNQLTKPNYAEMPLGTYANASNTIESEDHVGYPAYNASIIFDLDSYGTTSNPWLNQIQIVALPVGSPQDIASNFGKVLYDTVAAQAPGTDYTGAHIGGTGARYRVYVGGLTAGIAYNVYVVYIDFFGNTSYFGPTYETSRIATTALNPITITNLPGIGILPTVGYDSQSVSGVGQTQFNANVKFEINYTGTDAASWLEEIRLYATYWDASANGGTGLPDGSGAPYTYPSGQPAAPVLVNIIGPNLSVNTNKVYFAEWPGLSLGSGIYTQYLYRLSITFVAENGQESNYYHLCYTNNQVVTLWRPALAGVSPYAPPITLHGSPGFPFNGNPVYDCEFVFDTDATGSIANYGLNYLQLVAYPYGADITSASNLGKILYDELTPLKPGFDYNGNGTGLPGARYHGYVGGLNGGTEYHIAVIYVGFDGSVSQPTVVVNTGDYGSHIVTNNNLPGVGTVPVITEVNHTETPVGNSAYNELLSYTVNYTGTNSYQWLQEIELYSCLWDTVNNRPALLADGVTYSTPILRNTVSPGIIVNGTGTVTYIGEWPGLVASNNSGAPYYYRLGVRFVAQNGSKSDNSANNGSFGHLDPVTYIYTTAAFTQIVQRGTLATLASYATPSMTVDSGYPQYPFDGDPIYACDIVFDTTDGATGTQANSALDYVLVSAYPVGADLTTSHNINIVSPQRQGYDYNGTNVGIGGTRYKVRVGGLTGGTHYVIVAQYVDFAGLKTSPKVLVSDTGTHPVLYTNLPGVGSQPPITFQAATESVAGSSSFNSLVAVQLSSTGIDTSWCEEIELYSCLWNPTTNAPAKLADNTTYATPTLLNIISFIPTSSTANYLWEFPALTASNGIADPNNSGNTNYYYALGCRFVAINGDKSDNSSNNGVFGHSDPTTYIFTGGTTKLIVSSAQIVNRSVLATMQTNFVPGLPAASSISAPQGSNDKQYQNVTINFTPSVNGFTTSSSTALANTDGYLNNTWLDKIRVFCCDIYYGTSAITVQYGAAGDDPYGGSNPDGSTGITTILSTTSIYKATHQYIDLTPQASGGYTVNFKIPVGRSYVFLYAFLDHAGTISCPQGLITSSSTRTGSGYLGYLLSSGFFLSYTAGNLPVTQLNPSTTFNAAGYKIGSVWYYYFTNSTNTTSYPQFVQYVEYWLMQLNSSGVEIGSPIQRQKLPATSDGNYSASFSSLVASTSYRIYTQYDAYGLENNPWPSANPYFQSNSGYYQFTTGA